MTQNTPTRTCGYFTHSATTPPRPPPARVRAHGAWTRPPPSARGRETQLLAFCRRRLAWTRRVVLLASGLRWRVVGAGAGHYRATFGQSSAQRRGVSGATWDHGERREPTGGHRRPRGMPREPTEDHGRQRAPTRRSGRPLANFGASSGQWRVASGAVWDHGGTRETAGNHEMLGHARLRSAMPRHARIHSATLRH